MVVEFKDNNCFCGVKDIFIRDSKKLLKIFYGANGDLDFDIFGSCNKNENGLRAAIPNIKQHEEVYQYFEQFVNCIIGCEVFDMSDIELEFCDFDNDVTNELNSTQKKK